MNRKIHYTFSCTFATILLLVSGSCSGDHKPAGKAGRNDDSRTEIVSNDAVASVKERGAEDSTVAMNNGDTEDNLPTVIDFYATWCGPCKQIAPLFEVLKGEYAGKVKFMSVDVDQDVEMVTKYGIQAMPTFVMLDASGNEIERIVGADPDQLSAAVDKLAK